MKKIITAILIFFSLTGFAQNKDSIPRVQSQKAITEIVTKTPVAELNEFLYKSMTAEKYNEFVQYYNEFIRQKYQQKKQK